MDAGDRRLLARADALRLEGLTVLRRLNLEEAFSGFGGMETCGSVVSNLMVWADLDVMFTAPHVDAGDVLLAMGRLVTRPGIIALDYRDELADRRPTPRPVDERYYVVCGYQGPQRHWKIDITIWLHDVQRPIRAEAKRLAAIALDQRLAILRLKDVWHRGPTYPTQVSGIDIYDAVLNHGVRSTEEFASYLREHGLPSALDGP